MQFSAEVINKEVEEDESAHTDTDTHTCTHVLPRKMISTEERKCTVVDIP